MNAFQDLVAIVKRLRGPNGCPWDKAQDARSLRPYLLEETYEVLDAIETGDDVELVGELGDLLFQVVFLVDLVESRGTFTMEDVLLRIGEKMVRRHPHVFDANYKSNTDDGAIGAWEARKARERGMDTSALDGVPNSLPALLRSYRIAEKASAVGFDWPSIDGIQEKLNEELEELNEALATGDEFAIESEFGDVLLSLVNLSRFLPTDPENALKGATNRFEKRFRHVEHTVAKTGGTVHDTPLDELERLWQQAKEET